ncbi:MAG: hypothetical protein SGJ19_06040 [Planctomycetia bacterium]|nr:hypothetical protein [Planctomycetia bacterium]
MSILLWPIATVLVTPGVALIVARRYCEPRYDKAVLRTLFLVCAASWAFGGVALTWLWALFSMGSGARGPGDNFGPTIIIVAFAATSFGLPAIPLTVVSMIEYGKRRSTERVMLIPFAMLAVCVVAAMLLMIWHQVFGK